MDQCFELNSDGSSLGNPGLAELLVINQGLLLAWTIGIRYLICETDSKLLVVFITAGVLPFHVYAPLVNHIHSFVPKEWNVSINHTFREGNNCADLLAKRGSSSPCET